MWKHREDRAEGKSPKSTISVFQQQSTHDQTSHLCDGLGSCGWEELITIIYWAVTTNWSMINNKEGREVISEEIKDLEEGPNQFPGRNEGIITTGR